MPARERTSEGGASRGRRLVADLGRDLRTARVSHGLSQEAVARAVGISDSRVSLIERGRVLSVSVLAVARLGAAVGLELSGRFFPSGQPIRDAAHLALLAKLRTHVSDALRWATEVPLRRPGDQRAWDALIIAAAFSIGVECETRLHDVQALLRRLALKKRDGEVTRLVLVLADTRWNRAVVNAHPAEFGGTGPSRRRPHSKRYGLVGIPAETRSCGFRWRAGRMRASAGVDAARAGGASGLTAFRVANVSGRASGSRADFLREARRSGAALRLAQPMCTQGRHSAAYIRQAKTPAPHQETRLAVSGLRRAEMRP